MHTTVVTRKTSLPVYNTRFTCYCYWNVNFNWMTIDFVVISSAPDVNVCLDGFMIIKHKPSINRIRVHTQWNNECYNIVEIVDTPLPFRTCICKSSSSPTHRCPHIYIYIYPTLFCLLN